MKTQDITITPESVASHAFFQPYRSSTLVSISPWVKLKANVCSSKITAQCPPSHGWKPGGWAAWITLGILGTPLLAKHHIICPFSHAQEHAVESSNGEEATSSIPACRLWYFINKMPHHDRTVRPFTLMTKVSGYVRSFSQHTVVQQSLYQHCLQAKPRMDVEVIGMNTMWPLTSSISPSSMGNRYLGSQVYPRPWHSAWC